MSIQASERFGGRSLDVITVTKEYKEYKEYEERSQEPQSRSQEDWRWESDGERTPWLKSNQ